jgi:hypothetical protein
MNLKRFAERFDPALMIGLSTILLAYATALAAFVVPAI